jgi:hypothetical protein
MKAIGLMSLYQPGRRDEAGWYCLCFGSDNEPVESGASSGGIPPLLSILLSMNQVCISILTAYISIVYVYVYCTQVVNVVKQSICEHVYRNQIMSIKRKLIDRACVHIF